VAAVVENSFHVPAHMRRMHVSLTANVSNPSLKPLSPYLSASCTTPRSDIRR
jgi:hypothetical protein